MAAAVMAEGRGAVARGAAVTVAAAMAAAMAKGRGAVARGAVVTVAAAMAAAEMEAA